MFRIGYHHHPFCVMKTIKNSPRSCILRVGAKSGRLCAWMAEHEEDTVAIASTAQEPEVSFFVMAMVDLLKELYWTSISLNLHWVQAVHSKLELNRRKYPVELCKVRRCRNTDHLCVPCRICNDCDFVKHASWYGT